MLAEHVVEHKKIVSTLKEVLGWLAVSEDKTGVSEEPLEIDVFDLPDRHVFSLYWPDSNFYGDRFKALLTQARPRNIFGGVEPQSEAAILADWEMPEHPNSEENQRLIALHKNIPGWVEFVEGDRRKYIAALTAQWPSSTTNLLEKKIDQYASAERIHTALGVLESKYAGGFGDELEVRYLGNDVVEVSCAGSRITYRLSFDGKEQIIDADIKDSKDHGLLPWLVWSLPKNSNNRSSRDSVDLEVDSAANRRLGFLLATGFSPRQRDTLRRRHSAKKGGNKNDMQEAQITALATMYEKRIFRSRLFERVEELTGVSKPSWAKRLRRIIIEAQDFLKGGTDNSLIPIGTLASAAVACFAGLVMIGWGVTDLPRAGAEIGLGLFDRSEGSGEYRLSLARDMRPGFGGGFNRGNKDISLILGGIGLIAGGVGAALKL